MRVMRAFVAICSAFLLLGCTASAGRSNASLRCEATGSIERDMVTLISTARSAPRQCGSERFVAAAPITWNTRLARAAHQHAQDMAAGDFLDHRGSDGSVAGTRVRAAGYAWQTVGENVSAGYATSQQTVQGWLGSAHHCTNIMDQRFTEIGAACVRHKASRYGTYWTLVLAAPRQ